jgi:hypothetical protein
VDEIVGTRRRQRRLYPGELPAHRLRPSDDGLRSVKGEIVDGPRSARGPRPTPVSPPVPGQSCSPAGHADVPP